jgi:hypothetical protein
MGRVYGNELAAQLDARRTASWRLPPLGCGCRDPLECRCTPPPPTERMVDAGRAAALHLLELGHTPILEPGTLRGLWARSGHDRALARYLHTLTGGLAA